MPFIQGRNESIKQYKIKHVFLASFSYLFCSYTEMRHSFNIHMSGCTHLRTKAWTCPLFLSSLGSYVVLCSLKTTFCRSLRFSQWPAPAGHCLGHYGDHSGQGSDVSWRPCPGVWYTQDAFRWSRSCPLGGLHCWALQKSFSASQLAGQMWAQAQVVCFSPSLSHHTEI